jgi:signal peptidase I
MVKLTATGPLDNTPEFVVPADSLFMMGDNRDNSLDSRVPAVDGGVGFVPLDNVVGRARVVLGSFDFLNVAWNPATWLGRVRASRFLARIG